MKKLLLFVIICFVACVGTQVKKDIPGLLEVEGAELYPLKYFTGYTIEQINTWAMLEAGEMADGGSGFIKGRLYVYRVFQHPKDLMSIAMVIYITEPERAERIGLMSIHPFAGPQLVSVLDRYKNSDQWYLFDVEEWDRQHSKNLKPSKADPNRFDRHDACVRAVN